jgi:O-antigen/teichoic acid export membrane protein
MFVSIRLYETYLGKDLFGQIMVALQILQYLPLLDGGFRLTTNRALLAGMDAEERRGLLIFGQTLYSWVAIGALALGLILMLGYSLTPNVRSFGLPLAFFLTLGALGAWVTLGSAQTQLLIGLGLQSRLFALNTLHAWLQLAGIYLGFRSGLHIWSIPIAMGAAWLITVAIALYWIRSKQPDLPWLQFKWDASFKKRLRDFWPSARAALRMQVVTVLLYTLDPIVVLLVAPESHLAIYVLLARLFTILRTTLQAADEALWPILAQRAAGSADMSAALVRVNGWIYGIMMAGAAMTLPAFLDTYMKEDWEPDPWLVALFAVRYLITGLCSQPAYYLYGAGRFQALARHLTWELTLGTGVAIVLGLWLGGVGVILGYVLGTLAGTALPLPLAYLKASNNRVAPFFIGTWGRAILGASLTSLIATLGLPWVESWPMVIVLGGIATSGTFVILLIQAGIRARLSGKMDVQSVVQFI